MTVNFELIPDKEVWFLNSKPGEQPEITKSSQDEPQIIFSLSQETLPAIYLGEMTALTEMGREIMSDQIPLDFTLGKVISTTPALMANLLAFVQRFSTPPTRKKLFSISLSPFQQAFIIILGKGYAQTSEYLINVRAGEAYYIPPQSDHVLWNENPEPLCLICLAWGEKA